MKPSAHTKFGRGQSFRLRLIVGGASVIVMMLILTGIAADVFWTFVNFTLRNGG